MTGSITKYEGRKGVTWRYRFSPGKDASGKRIWIAEQGYSKKSEAATAMRDAMANYKAGLEPQVDARTLGAFIDQYLTQHAPRNCTPKTVERYRQLAAYIPARLKETLIQDVSPAALEATINHLQDAGGKTRKGKARPLSARTVRHIAFLLHAIFGKAERLSIVERNPMVPVELPKLPARPNRAADESQLQGLLARIAGHQFYPFIVLALGTGARRGELLALTWSDLQGAVISIGKSLEQTKGGLRIKSTKSEKPRQITISPSAIELLAFLREKQETYRQQFGEHYREHDLIFCTLDGDYLRPDSVTATVSRLFNEAGLKGLSLHSLRHTHGSHLLSQGVPLPLVSERLGHASPAITSQIYAHALRKDDQIAATSFETLMQSVMPGSKMTQ